MAKAEVSPAEQETTYLALRDAEPLKKGAGKERENRILKNLWQRKEGETVMDGATWEDKTGSAEENKMT